MRQEEFNWLAVQIFLLGGLILCIRSILKSQSAKNKRLGTTWYDAFVAVILRWPPRRATGEDRFSGCIEHLNTDSVGSRSSRHRGVDTSSRRAVATTTSSVTNTARLRNRRGGLSAKSKPSPSVSQKAPRSLDTAAINKLDLLERLSVSSDDDDDSATGSRIGNGIKRTGYVTSPPLVAASLSSLAPEPSAELTVSFPAPHTAILQWAPREHGGGLVVGFDVSYGLSEKSLAHFSRIGPQDRSVSIPRLSGSTEYHFSVAVVSETGKSSWGTKVATTPFPVTPSAPSSLVADDPQQHSVRLTWREPADDGGSPVVQYIIWAEVERQWFQIAQRNGQVVDQSTAVVSDLMEDTSYRFRLQAVNAVGGSLHSDTSNTTRTLQSLPEAPQAVRSRDIGQHQLQLSWDAPAKETVRKVHGYVIHMRSGFRDWKELATNSSSSSTSIFVDDLNENSLYEFRVAAMNAVGVGLWSATHSVWTLPPPPVAPEAPEIDLVTTASAEVSWALAETDIGDSLASEIQAQRWSRNAAGAQPQALLSTVPVEAASLPSSLASKTAVNQISVTRSGIDDPAKNDEWATEGDTYVESANVPVKSVAVRSRITASSSSGSCWKPTLRHMQPLKQMQK